MRELAVGDLVAVPIDGLALQRTLWPIVPRSVQLSPAPRAFLQLPEETLRASSGSELRLAGS